MFKNENDYVSSADSPICVKKQPRIYGAGHNQTVNLSCEVEAKPDPHRFYWSFNTSNRQADIPNNLVTSSGGGVSYASYTPIGHKDYGSLICWAVNDVGRQQVPCVFQVRIKLYFCFFSLILSRLRKLLENNCSSSNSLNMKI